MKAQFVSGSMVLLLACGGSALDVGSNKGGSGSSVEGGSDSGGSDSARGGEVAERGGENGLGGSFARGGAPNMATGGTSVGARGPMFATGGAMTVAGGATQATGGRPIASGGSTVMGGMAVGGGGVPANALVPQVCDKAFHQVWEGTTLDFFFNPQDDRYRIEFDGTDANGRLCGTVTYIGAGQPAPPPATDPDAGYPPSLDFTMAHVKSVQPGVTYSIIQGAEADAVRHFRIAPNELWKDWCALQTPVPNAGSYSCIGGDGGWSSDGVTCTITNPDGTQEHYPQAKCELCSFPGVCACDSEHCVAADGDSLLFDLKLNGPQMTGTIGATQAKFDLVN
jgi:hypothetical protein